MTDKQLIKFSERFLCAIRWNAWNSDVMDSKLIADAMDLIHNVAEWVGNPSCNYKKILMGDIQRFDKRYPKIFRQSVRDMWRDAKRLIRK